MPDSDPRSRRSTLSEGEFLRTLQAQAASRARRVRIGIGDDCAVLRPPRGHEVMVTTDMLLETTHFRRDWHSPESAGHRCLARGLSDLAAMGSRPLAAFLSLAIPPSLSGAWMARFLKGLLALAAVADVPLAGGDTAEAPGDVSALFSADITLLGSAPSGTALLRSGARAGDALYVTGTLGGAAAELAILAAQQPATRPAASVRLRAAAPAHPQLFPTPRLAQGLRLRSLASAAIDLSDGLSTDLTHLCEASGVRAEVEAASLPFHPLAHGSVDSLALVLHGGEDYELLFTAPQTIMMPRSLAGIPVSRIGSIHPRRKGAPRITLIGLNGRPQPLAAQGWEHFRSKPTR